MSAFAPRPPAVARYKVDTKKEAAPGRDAVKTAGEAEGVTWSSVLGGVDGALVLFVG